MRDTLVGRPRSPNSSATSLTKTPRESSANSFQVTPDFSSQRATGHSQRRQAVTIGRWD